MRKGLCLCRLYYSIGERLFKMSFYLFIYFTFLLTRLLSSLVFKLYVNVWTMGLKKGFFIFFVVCEYINQQIEIRVEKNNPFFICIAYWMFFYLQMRARKNLHLIKISFIKLSLRVELILFCKWLTILCIL